MELTHFYLTSSLQHLQPSSLHLELSWTYSSFPLAASLIFPPWWRVH
ncbi:hypothetical protein OIU74_017934, partial [Salix koriyanagi]